jgi:hypothetical protein
MIAEDKARSGAEVTVVGLSSTDAGVNERSVGTGKVRTVAIKRNRYRKENWALRLAWSMISNALIIAKAWRYMRRAEVIRFTGSPAFLLHFVAAANVILRKRLLYRITDFYPECIIAALSRKHVGLEILRALTNRVRRRVDMFEVIGNDMRARLQDCGIPAGRIVLHRDGSPVPIAPDAEPLAVPPALNGHKILLYSGNWGVAHDIDTFFEGYRRHHANGSGSVVLWLNATGSGADALECRLRAAGVPFVRQKLVALSELARLLVTPDAHLITLKNAFAGYVLPSKVYGCIDSKRPILYIGPPESDVHQLCRSTPGLGYHQIEVGDAAAVEAALSSIGGQNECATDRALPSRLAAGPPAGENVASYREGAGAARKVM